MDYYGYNVRGIFGHRAICKTTPKPEREALGFVVKFFPPGRLVRL